MFRLYDLNMNEKYLPAGVRPLDITISSIGKEHITESVEGASGVINYGSRDTTRDIELFFFFDTDDSLHFRQLRNELFNLFSGPMYVVEDSFPDRRFLAEIVSSFTPRRYLGSSSGELAIPLETKELPYAESIETEIETSLSFTVDGDIPIDPFKQLLEISIKNVSGSTSYFQLHNTRNGTRFRFNEAVLSSQVIDIKGVVVTLNNLQALRKTEKEFIRLDPGLNSLQITGATSADITIKYRNYYR